ncbi:Uncharacterized protein QTN25_004253 [Entamoeba marina]
MSKTTVGMIKPLSLDIPGDLDNASYSYSVLAKHFVVNVYSNSKTILCSPLDGGKPLKIVGENKLGCYLMSQYDDTFYYYVHPEELHFDGELKEKKYVFHGEDGTLLGTSLLLETEKKLYCISNTKICTLEKKNLDKVLTICHLDKSFSSFAKESTVIDENHILLADSVVNMGNLHFKIWDLVNNKVVAQLYRVPGENEPNYSQLLSKELFMGMGTSIYYCKIPQDFNPDEVITLTFKRHEFHDRAIQSFLIEKDYAFVGDSYGMVTLHAYPSFEFLNLISLGVERDEQVKHFDERPVFSFRNSVVGFKRIYHYILFWLLNGSVHLYDFFKKEKVIDSYNAVDNKHQLREIYTTLTDHLTITLRFNVLKDQHSAIIPLNEFFSWDLNINPPIPPQDAFEDFFNIFPKIIKTIYTTLTTHSKNVEMIKDIIKETYFIVNTIIAIKRKTDAIIPFEFFLGLIDGLNKVNDFLKEETKKSQEDVALLLKKENENLIVLIDDSVAIAQQKIDMLSDGNKTKSTKDLLETKLIHFDHSLRKLYGADLLNEKYVIDETDQRMKQFYLDSQCFLLEKQKDFTRHSNQLTQFCISNDMGASMDAHEIVKTSALLSQISQELAETYDDIKSLIAEGFASDKWLEEEKRIFEHFN